MHHGPVFCTEAWHLAAYILATLENARRAGVDPLQAIDLEELEELARATVCEEEAERIIRMRYLR